jgi:uncharacterized protein
MARRVNCPQCGTPAEYSPENRFRPFCSERCRLIDRGAWASDQYRIPAAPQEDGEAAPEMPKDDD